MGFARAVDGDVNVSGAINVFDVLAVANVAAGNTLLLPATNPDFAVAGGVAPANSPGLGESTDPIPPGLELSGTRTVNVSDALAIGSALRGANAPNPATVPASFPQLYGVTIVHTGVGGPVGAPAILLHDGTAGFVRNLIISGWPGAGVGINGVESCGLALSSPLAVEFGVYFGNQADFSSDPDCVDEVALGAAVGAGNLFLDPQWLAPGVTLSPDLRPDNGSPAGTPGATPPPDGFFSPNGADRGALAMATPARANIPWYAGWSKGF